MSLLKQLSDDLNEALKCGDKTRVSMLRMIKSSVKNKEIEKGDALSDDEIRAILRSFVKKGQESVDQFTRAGRDDLAEKERAELAVVKSYLPKQLSDDETREVVSNVISEMGVSDPRDMGRVMKAIMDRCKGTIDGKRASQIVKQILEAK